LAKTQSGNAVAGKPGVFIGKKSASIFIRTGSSGGTKKKGASGSTLSDVQCGHCGRSGVTVALFVRGAGVRPGQPQQLLPAHGVLDAQAFAGRWLGLARLALVASV
jgi:hypothetical protein